MIDIHDKLPTDLIIGNEYTKKEILIEGGLLR